MENNILSKIANSLYSIDLFGKSFSFEEKGNNKFTTTIGAIFTIFILFSTVVLGCFFGMEMIYKENPAVISSNELVNSNETIVNSKDFPIIINLVDRFGVPIENIEKILKVQVVHYNVSETFASSVTPHQYGLCNPDDYNDESKVYVESAIKEILLKNNQSSSYCMKPKDNLYFHGKYTARNSSFIIITFNLCNQTTDSCMPDMEKYLDFNFYLVFRYINTYLDPKNFKNPIVKYLDTVTTHIGSNIAKRSYFRFIRNKLIDDNGVFIESYNTTKYITLSSIFNDVIPTKGSQLFVLTLESLSIATKTVRSYMKIQELIAKIGGLYNGFKIITMILINGYVSFSYYFKINDTIEKKKEHLKKAMNKSNSNDINNNINKIKLKNNYVEKEKKENNENNENDLGNSKSILNLNTISDEKNKFEGSINRIVFYFKVVFSKIFCFLYRKENKMYKMMLSTVNNQISFYNYIDLKLDASIIKENT